MSVSKLFSGKINILLRQPVRFRRTSLGVSPHLGLSLKQKLEKFGPKDTFQKVDIGFAAVAPSRKEELEKMKEYIKARKNDPEFLKQVKDRKVNISPEEVHEEWIDQYAVNQIRTIADHYGIFEHLFGDAYFHPIVNLNIDFTHNELKIPVHKGNIIKPEEAGSAPSVDYKSDPNSLWTLLLTNPDGHLSKTDSEYVHWFIGNIPGNNLSKGKEIFSYLRPFPPKGTGYQRLVFILYKQDKEIDFSKHQKTSSSLNLDDRDFSTYDFYCEHQDSITPAGLSFFQSDWDRSVSKFFHDDLNVKEPIFEYDYPVEYIKPQTWWPLREPFNLYLDKYRDPKQIAKEYFLRRMKKVHPFEPPKYVLKYPGAYRYNRADPDRDPSWLFREKLKERLKWGRVNDF
ncbi:unnamed protein product [Bemisia tabaci]|uniref:Large ribosomal subunit protein mL38 n=1 Tax=Bemisia tabaci TaxID=7038 RepID=A0A9P0AGA6_BEMTA|nr:unnamed protein product [Bemisia tabaci]